MSMVTLATVAAACLALATAAPTHDVLSVDLDEVMDKSVCPIRVRIDDDEHRIPRRIKMLECARTPNPMCQKQHTKHACCGIHHHNFKTQCVNVRDHVLVRYTNLGDDQALHKVDVSVGCACMLREETPALEDR